MCKRFCLSLSATAVLALSTMSIVGHAQNAPPPPPPTAIVSAWHAQFTKWTPPRTPWGDPDIQGNFTATDEIDTPLERPAAFEGRNLTEITPAEIATINKANRVAAAGDSVQGAIPTGWYEYEYHNNTRAWHVIDPPDGKLPPLTPAAAAFLKEHPEPGAGSRRVDQASSRTARGTNLATYMDWSLSDRCITRNSPPESMIPGRLGSQVHIVQTPEFVMMRYEELRTMRIIPLKGRREERPREPYALRPYNGDATAWFEGNTLVVDTVYHDKDVDVMDAPAKTTRTIERFTRRTNPAGIEYTATMINPDWWVRPWTFQQILHEDDRGGLIFEYTCHEHNHSIVNALSGARYEERRETERKARAEQREKEAAQGGQR